MFLLSFAYIRLCVLPCSVAKRRPSVCAIFRTGFVEGFLGVWPPQEMAGPPMKLKTVGGAGWTILSDEHYMLPYFMTACSLLFRMSTEMLLTTDAPPPLEIWQIVSGQYFNVKANTAWLLHWVSVNIWNAFFRRRITFSGWLMLSNWVSPVW